MGNSLRIVVSGLIAQYPLGGVAWDYAQYPAGLAALGHDVYYIEDTGQWPYNPAQAALTDDCSFNVRHLASVMERFDMGDRWAYRCPFDGAWSGLDSSQRADVLATADLVLNVSGTIRRAEELGLRARLAFVDSDPVFTQVKLARGQAQFAALIDSHDVHFTFGESLSDDIPDTGHTWLPTRQPILLDEWEFDGPHRGVFTTVMNWTSFNTVLWNGRQYGQKDVEFDRFLDLPEVGSPSRLEIAVSAGKNRKAPIDLLEHKGWSLVDPLQSLLSPESYRTYIQTSMAEWSVAKNGYVVGQPGWFSCRSACYLAASRPVVVQDTGFSSVIPVGEGVLAFADLEGAVAGLREVEDDYARHSVAARAIAEEYFDSAGVLSSLIDAAMTEAGTSR